MRLTQDVIIAIELVKFLNDKKPVSLTVFCHRTRYSGPFTEQIARKLRIGGVLVSKHGPTGGYMLTGKKPSIFDLYAILKRTSKSHRLVIDNREARHAMETFLMTQMKRKAA